MKTDYLVHIYYNTPGPGLDSTTCSTLEEAQEKLREKLNRNFLIIKSYKILERKQHLSFKTILEVGN